METLVKITSADLTEKLLAGLEDSPSLGTLGMQQRFDAHPNLIDTKFNAMVDAQNANNALILPKGGTTAYTPTGDYDPATKKFVTDSVNEGGNVTPEQAALISQIPQVKSTTDLYLYKNYGGAF